jgi:hypothetical protein
MRDRWATLLIVGLLLGLLGVLVWRAMKVP